MSNRFAMIRGVVDPQRRASAQKFRRIQTNVECIYARGSRHWGAPDWRVGAGLDENLGLLTADLETFVAFEGEWDGYVIEIAEPGAGHSVQSLAYWVDVVLRGLSARDRRQDSDLFVAVELKSWWYRFSAVKFFVSTFAPCYDSASSRFTFGVPSCFLLLQPESAFDRAFSRKQGMTPSDVRHFIREKFSAAGRRYDLSITCSAYEAHRYVKPLRSGDSVVRWWECGCDGALDRHDDSLYVEEPTDATEYEI